MKHYGPHYTFLNIARRASERVVIRKEYKLGKLCAVFFFILSVLLTGGASKVNAQSRLLINPNNLSFGNVTVGSSAAISITLTNSGSSGIVFSKESVLFGADFSVIGFALPLTLGAGKQLTLIVQYRPRSTGASTGKIIFESNAWNSPYYVVMSGTGVSPPAGGTGQLTDTPTTVSFGNVPVGTNNTQTIQLMNTGTASVAISNISSPASPFKISGISAPVTLAVGKTVSFTIEFSPTSAATSRSSFTVTSNAANRTTIIPVAGTGVVSTQTLNANPANLNFGNIGVGGLITKDVALQNTGNSSVTVRSVGLSGNGFSMTGVSSGSTIAAGQSAVLIVEFAPKSNGGATGNITIMSNASNGSTLTIPVAGTGVTTSGHQVQLDWAASTSSGVVGYNVYRSTVSGGSYAKIVSTPVGGTSYADQNVQSGVVYYYVVTSVDAQGTESSPSNQTSASIP